MLLIAVLLCVCSITEARFIVSEVSSDGGSEFVELAAINETDDNYYALMVITEQQGNMKIEWVANLGRPRGYLVFCSVSYFRYYSDLCDHTCDIMPYGDVTPTGLIVIRENSFTRLLDVSDKFIDGAMRNVISEHIVDIFVFARYAYKTCCPFFALLSHIVYGDDYEVFRELDLMGHADLSLNNCDHPTDGAENPRKKNRNILLGQLTPGEPNDCTGPRFVVENLLRRANDSFLSSNISCYAELASFPKPAELTMARDMLVSAKETINNIPLNTTENRTTNTIHKRWEDIFGLEQQSGTAAGGSNFAGGVGAAGGFFLGLFGGGILAAIFWGIGGVFESTGAIGTAMGTSIATGTSVGSSDAGSQSSQPSDQGTDADSQKTEDKKQKSSDDDDDANDSREKSKKRKWCERDDNIDVQPELDANEYSCFMSGNHSNPDPSTCGLVGEEAQLYKMSSLAKCELEESRFSVGAENLADLLLTRGGGIYEWQKIDLHKLFICKKHIEELGPQWSKTVRMMYFKFSQKRICVIPEVADFVHDVKAIGDTTVTKLHSQALLKLKNIFVPIGSSTCRTHRELINALAAEYTVAEKGRCISPPVNITLAEVPDAPDSQKTFRSSQSDVCGSAGGGSDYCPVSSQESAGAEKDQMKEALRMFAAVNKISQLHVTKSGTIMSLTEVGRQRRVRAIRQMIRRTCEIIAENDADVLEKLLFQKSSIWHAPEGSQIDDILSAVAESYLSSTTSNVKKFVLSVASTKIPFASLTQYIPGLSHYMYTASRSFAQHYGVPISAPLRRSRFNKVSVEYFIGFITSPHVIGDLPYGSAHLKLSDGSKVQVANMIRNTINSYIVQQYTQFMTQNGKEEHLMSRSSLLRILEICQATTRKSLSGLDLFSYELSEALDNLSEILSTLNDLYCDSEWYKEACKNLLDAKHYLKSDLKLHLKQSSRVPDHCIRYSLSDANDDRFSAGIEGHSHDLLCDRCESMKRLLKDIRERIESAPFAAEHDKINTLHTFEQSRDRIHRYRQHLIRSHNQEIARSDTMNKLKSTEVYVHLDFAMKFVPLSGRECQAMFFGKRGIAWHMSVLYRKDRGRVYSRTYVHVIDQAKQDSNAVTAILTDVLQRTKLEHSKISAAYVRSDNAGAYHSSSTLGSVSHISHHTRIKVKRWDFSESQSGKGPCDRAAALVKNRVRVFAAEGHHCTTASEFQTCAQSHGGLKGVSVLNGEIILNPMEATAAIAIPGVKSYFSFAFGPTHIQCHKAYAVGRGEAIRHPDFLGRHNTARFQSLSDISGNAEEPTDRDETPGWREVSGRYAPDQTVTHDDDGDEEADVAVSSISPDSKGGMYQCPEAGCTLSFKRLENVEKHMELADHIYVHERETLRDFVVNGYRQALEAFDVQPEMPIVDDAINNLVTAGEDSPSVDPMPMGWALHSHRKSVRHNKKQKSFLDEIFHRGLQTGHKKTPQQVAKMMMETLDGGKPKFSPSEYLDWKQIQSYFGRLATVGSAGSTDPTDADTVEETDEAVAAVETAVEDLEIAIRCDLSNLHIDDD